MKIPPSYNQTHPVRYYGWGEFALYMGLSLLLVGCGAVIPLLLGLTHGWHGLIIYVCLALWLALNRWTPCAPPRPPYGG